MGASSDGGVPSPALLLHGVSGWSGKGAQETCSEPPPPIPTGAHCSYYVHACPKMRYKAEYAPSDLRCPVTGLWVPLAACVARLDADKHAALADESPAEAEERRRRDSAALAALLPAVPIILGGGGGGDSLLLLRELNKRGQGILVGILRELLPRLGGLSGGGLASRVVAFVR